MTRLFENLKLLSVLKIPVRYKGNPPHHWSVLRKKKTNSMKALDHFDDLYKSVYGEESWKNIRAALLSEKHKYVAVMNNFGDIEEASERLEALGAMNMKNIYKAFQTSMDYSKPKQLDGVVEEVDDRKERISDIIAEKKSALPYSDTFQESLKNSDFKSIDQGFEPVQLQSIETNVTVSGDSSRIIRASAGLSASQLYEYVPATKIKGMDDFVLESEHLNYYTQGADFSIKVEEERELNFPDRLVIYTFEENSDMKFPKAKVGSTEVSDYFVLDGASIFPVLSLDLQPGDTVLDMCAAPGGKSMMALQTLLPRLIVANDAQESRINRINNFLEEMLPDIDDWQKKFFVTHNDARYIEDVNVYNKILVDVPCTTDRHCVHEDDNNIFKHSRIKERLRLPELQSAILKNALKLVVPGGTVVYSTCSMSPIQNDGVVQVALKGAYEEFNSVFVVKDQTRALAPLQYLYNFGADYGLRYGHIVLPSKSRNWGPMYFCKMVRVQ